MKNQEPKKYEKITVSFTEADADLIEYLDNFKKAHKTSDFVRKAIREKMERNNKEKNIVAVNKNVLRKIENLERRIELVENIVLENNSKVIEEKQENDKANINNISKNKEEKKSNKENDIDESISNALNYFEF